MGALSEVHAYHKDLHHSSRLWPVSDAVHTANRRAWKNYHRGALRYSQRFTGQNMGKHSVKLCENHSEYPVVKKNTAVTHKKTGLLFSEQPGPLVSRMENQTN